MELLVRLSFDLGCGATNMQLYLSISSDPKEVVETLVQCLEGVMGWMKAIKLKLVGSNLVLRSGCTPLLAGVTLTPKASVHSLGVLLDPGLLMEDHVADVAMSAWCQLWLVHQLHPLLDNKGLAIVNHALFMFKLNYCS